MAKELAGQKSGEGRRRASAASTPPIGLTLITWAIPRATLLMCLFQGAVGCERATQVTLPNTSLTRSWEGLGNELIPVRPHDTVLVPSKYNTVSELWQPSDRAGVSGRIIRWFAEPVHYVPTISGAGSGGCTSSLGRCWSDAGVVSAVDEGAKFGGSHRKEVLKSTGEIEKDVVGVVTLKPMVT
jgi:hypothetical protein